MILYHGTSNQHNNSLEYTYISADITRCLFVILNAQGLLCSHSAGHALLALHQKRRVAVSVCVCVCVCVKNNFFCNVSEHNIMKRQETTTGTCVWKYTINHSMYRCLTQHMEKKVLIESNLLACVPLVTTYSKTYMTNRTMYMYTEYGKPTTNYKEWTNHSRYKCIPRNSDSKKPHVYQDLNHSHQLLCSLTITCTQQWSTICDV